MINKKRTPASEKRKLFTPIVAPQETAQTNNSIAKIKKSEKTKNEKIIGENTATKSATIETKSQNASKTLTPKDLVSRLGTDEKKIRIFLRKHYPQTHEKNQPWSITPELAKQIEKDFKNQTKAKETEKKQQITQDLTGNSDIEKAKAIGESNNASESSEVNDISKGETK